MKSNNSKRKSYIIRNSPTSHYMQILLGEILRAEIRSCKTGARAYSESTVNFVHYNASVCKNRKYM